MQPFMPEFLYALSAGDGADFTRYTDAVSTVVPAPTNNNPIPSRNGEPFGELGLVLQKDFAWQDQTGARDHIRCTIDVHHGNVGIVIDVPHVILLRTANATDDFDIGAGACEPGHEPAHPSVYPAYDDSRHDVAPTRRRMPIASSS
jgi:hypothetical protein